MSAGTANALWAASLLADARAFHRAAGDVARSQERLLLATLARNRDTRFGRDHDFATLRSVTDYRAAVPLAGFDAHEPYVERVAAGEANVLSRDRVRLLEPTSGSTSAAKLIPYTGELQRAFTRAVAPWVIDLFRHDPALMAGPAYWSISPALQREARTAGGVPIGFDDDSAYLGGIGRLLGRLALAVPSEVRFLGDVAAFRYATLLFLLRRPGLRLFSVWNPSFLTLLLGDLRVQGGRLADDLERGRISLDLPARQIGPLADRLAPDPARAEAVRRALDGSSDSASLHRALWPHLRLLSCWTDANAAPYARDLRALFPEVAMQGKGLIATEGFVSLPLVSQPAPVLAVRSHVFEFIAAEDDVRLAHELERGREYSVVLTSDVLYRYRLHDRVRVEGFYRECPLLRFLGKEALVSDHVGEKLSERHVRDALEAACDRLALAPRFSLLACERFDDGPAYALFVEGVEPLARAALAEAVEAELLANVHYAYCRRLGQLGALWVIPVRDGSARYEARLVAAGQQAGDVKPAVLSARSGWMGVLAPDTLDPSAPAGEERPPRG